MPALSLPHAFHSLRRRGRYVFGIALLALPGVGCRGAGAAADTAIVRDSAGITIVESTAPVWRDGAGWRLAPSPRVRIGVLDGAPEYQLFRVTGARRLPDGRLVVANGGTQELRFYDAAGHYISSTGRDGEGPGEFRGMGSLFTTGADSLVVSDFRLRRVSVFDAQGRFARSFTLQISAERASPSLAGVFADGTLLVSMGRVFGADEERGGVHRDPVAYYHLDRDGNISAPIGEYPGNDAYVQVSNAGSMRSMTVTSLPFGRPSVARAAGASFYFGSADRYEVAVHAPDGRLLRLIRREHENLTVTPQDIETLRRERLEQTTDAEWRRRLETMLREIPFPATMPAYSGFAIDAEGNFWVTEYRRPGDDQPRWSVFDAEGRWLGQLALPPRFTVYDIGSDYVLGRRFDDLDVERVELYELIKE